MGCRPAGSAGGTPLYRQIPRAGLRPSSPAGMDVRESRGGRDPPGDGIPLLLQTRYNPSPNPSSPFGSTWNPAEL